MSRDFAALAMASRAWHAVSNASRIDRLRNAIERTGMALPGLIAAPPRIAPPSATSAISGSLFRVYAAGVPVHADKYSLLRGDWRPATANYPQYNFAIADGVTRGTPPFDSYELRNSNKYNNAGNSLVRFFCASPDFEIQFFSAATATGFRLRVDGEFVQEGCLGLGLSSGAEGNYIRLTWGDGSADHRKPRLYEIEPLNGWKFGGIKSLAIDPPWPAPPQDGLKGIVHGASFVTGAGSTDTALLPGLGGQISMLLGCPDTLLSGIGSTGFISNGAGYSNFLQRVDIDVIPHAPDFIVELGGLNDAAIVNGNPATMQAAVGQWLDAVQDALPETLIFMTGPMSPGDPTSALLAVRDGKRAACDGRRNVSFIDNVAAGWVTGTGKLGAPKGDGNADWVTGGSDGADGTYPTDLGHTYLATRIADAVRRALNS